MRCSCRFSGGARNAVIWAESEGRVAQRRKGCRRTAMKSEQTVQRVMTKDSNAQGPDKKS